MKLSVPVFRLKRQARLLARTAALPLHEALDRVAREEGFRSWSHVSASLSSRRPGADLLAQLSPGDLMLLGARPGQGKTLLGLELAALAARRGRRGYFFTLDFNEADICRHLAALGLDPRDIGTLFSVDTSDGICADHIIRRLGDAPQGAVAVIDYLQLLDQRRANPELAVQIAELRAFARVTGAIIVAISQIDRAFDLRAKRMPDLSDVRLPNPLDLKVFTKTCFLHEGDMRLDATG